MKIKILFLNCLFIAAIILLIEGYCVADGGAPKTPVYVAIVKEKTITKQISFIGTTEAVAKSIVASEVSGIVEYFPVKEGDFITKGDLLVKLRSENLKFRLKAALAVKEKIKANLQYTKKELARISNLKNTNSIAAKRYDEVFYNQRASLQEIAQSEAEIERLEYEIKQKQVFAPFSGFISKEYTQVGEWINKGGSVVALVNLEQIHVVLDVPERYAIKLSPQNKVAAIIKSVSNNLIAGTIYAVLPEADSASRTFPVKINLENPELKIKSGMEAIVTFNFEGRENAMLVPKDAVITAGNNKLVFSISNGIATPVNIDIVGYYNKNVAVKGDLKSGDKVVIRGNERLRSGQPVLIMQ